MHQSQSLFQILQLSEALMTTYQDMSHVDTLGTFGLAGFLASCTTFLVTTLCLGFVLRLSAIFLRRHEDDRSG